MSVKVLFFARLREKMGMSSIDFMLDQPVTLTQFQVLLAAQYPIFVALPQPSLLQSIKILHSQSSWFQWAMKWHSSRL